jgi:hypothetical protein
MPQGLKPTLCCSRYARLEGPRFHGCAKFPSSSATCQSPRPEVQGLRSDARGLRSDARGPRSEVRGPRSKV